VSQHSSAREAHGLDEYQRLLSLLNERRFEEAQVRARFLLEEADAGPLSRAKTHNLLCWTFIEGLKYATPEAVLHGEEAVRLANNLGERPLQLQAMCNLASAYHQMGLYDQSRKTYREIIVHLGADPTLVPSGLVIAYQGLAQLETIQGRHADALYCLEQALEHCRKEESSLLLADLYRRQALVLLRLGRHEEAAQVQSQIQEHVVTSGPRSLWWKTHLSFSRARIELACGHWPQARTLATNALALARELGDMPVVAECTCLLALIDQAEGRREAAKRARKALTLAIHSGRRDVVDEVQDRLKDLLAYGI